MKFEILGSMKSELEPTEILSSRAVSKKTKDRFSPFDEKQILSSSQVQDLLRQLKSTLESLKPLAENIDLKEGIDRISESLNNEGLSYEIRSKALKVIKQTLLNYDDDKKIL
mgnify:FL=1